MLFCTAQALHHHPRRHTRAVSTVVSALRLRPEVELADKLLLRLGAINDGWWIHL